MFTFNLLGPVLSCKSLVLPSERKKHPEEIGNNDCVPIKLYLHSEVGSCICPSSQFPDPSFKCFAILSESFSTN